MLSTTPRTGPALRSGTRIHINGNGFFHSTYAQCRFGSFEVPALFVSSTEIICYTPSLPYHEELSWLKLSDHTYGYFQGDRQMLQLIPTAHHYPLYLSRLVQVEVTMNPMLKRIMDSGVKYRTLYGQQVSLIWGRRDVCGVHSDICVLTKVFLFLECALLDMYVT